MYQRHALIGFEQTAQEHVSSRYVLEHDPRPQFLILAGDERDSCKYDPNQSRVKEDRQQNAVRDYGSVSKRGADLSPVKNSNISYTHFAYDSARQDTLKDAATGALILSANWKKGGQGGI
jgi:hypothetical protein